MGVRSEAMKQYNKLAETTTPEGEQYLADYHWNLNQAQSLLKATAATGKIDRITSQLLKTIALVALLIAV